MQPAVSGHYRFRDRQVYRPAALSTIWKFVPQEPVTQGETGLRRNCAALPANRMCSAITVFIAGRLAMARPGFLPSLICPQR
jgi:hypothetical protein